MAGSTDKNAVVQLAAMPSTAINSELHGTIQITEPGVSDHIYDFFSTLAWVILIAGLVIAFRHHVIAYLDILKERLEKGAKVKIGGIEIEGIAAQSTNEQVARLNAEVQQAIADREDGAAELVQHIVDPQRVNRFKSVYLAAEDLALREVQTEFHTPISRNVKVGADGFDGSFTHGPFRYFVEVKLFTRSKLSTVGLRTIDVFVDTMSKYPRSVVGLLAIVYDADVDLIAERQNIEQMVSRGGPPIVVRTYALGALAEKYNVTISI